MIGKRLKLVVFLWEIFNITYAFLYKKYGLLRENIKKGGQTVKTTQILAIL